MRVDLERKLERRLDDLLRDFDREAYGKQEDKIMFKLNELSTRSVVHMEYSMLDAINRYAKHGEPNIALILTPLYDSIVAEVQSRKGTQ